MFANQISFQHVHRSMVLEKVSKKKAELQPKRKAKSIERSAEKKMITQTDVNRMILNFLCDGLVPLRTVENHSFKNIIQNGYLNCNVPCRRTITRLLMKEHSLQITGLTDELRNVSHVCITADGWSAHHR